MRTEKGKEEKQKGPLCITPRVMFVCVTTRRDAGLVISRRRRGAGRRRGGGGGAASLGPGGGH